ncbi:MAG TPA: hypothetical protein VGL99_28725 [Chloroflexota bacterium]
MTAALCSHAAPLAAVTPVTLVPISTTLNTPIGIDYHGPSNSFVMAANYPSGEPSNFELVAADGSHRLADGRGSTRLFSNAAGAVADTFDYDAVGNASARTGTTPINYEFRGEQFDSNIGAYYLRARRSRPSPTAQAGAGIRRLGQAHQSQDGSRQSSAERVPDGAREEVRQVWPA